jgi:prephenate dehydrogenase
VSNDIVASRPLVGIIGFGAFGRLMAQHLRPHFRLCAYDPALPSGAFTEMTDVILTSLAVTAGCSIVVLATPVSRLEETVSAISSLLRPGALVLDVGSVKLIFDTSNRQVFDRKHESALEKRRGTTLGVRLAGSGQAAGS